jgi:hypothetical protein
MLKDNAKEETSCRRVPGWRKSDRSSGSLRRQSLDRRDMTTTALRTAWTNDRQTLAIIEPVRKANQPLGTELQSVELKEPL